MGRPAARRGGRGSATVAGLVVDCLRVFIDHLIGLCPRIRGHLGHQRGHHESGDFGGRRGGEWGKYSGRSPAPSRSSGGFTEVALHRAPISRRLRSLQPNRSRAHRARAASRGHVEGCASSRRIVRPLRPEAGQDRACGAECRKGEAHSAPKPTFPGVCKHPRTGVDDDDDDDDDPVGTEAQRDGGGCLDTSRSLPSLLSS